MNTNISNQEAPLDSERKESLLESVNRANPGEGKNLSGSTTETIKTFTEEVRLTGQQIVKTGHAAVNAISDIAGKNGIDHQAIKDGAKLAGEKAVEYSNAFMKLVSNPFEKKKETKRQFIELLGHTDDRLFYINSKTGIGLNTKTKSVVLMSGDKIKVYPFEQISKWENNWQEGGAVIGGGLAGVVADMDRIKRNKENSGFIVSIKGDLDNTQWKIVMAKKEIQNRWFELMDQAINKGVAFD